MTKLEIIDETVEYYRTHKRAATDGGSCYYLKDGDMCAVGRCFTPDGLDKLGDYSATVDILVDQKGELGQWLKEKYHGHEVDFWRGLQNLHDRNSNWIHNDSGGQNLSPSGKDMLAHLKKAWK